MPQRTKSAPPAQEQESRNPIDHIEKFHKTKGGMYQCLVCQGNELEIDLSTGKMLCYNGGCDPDEIMDCILKPPKAKKERAKPNESPSPSPSTKPKSHSVAEAIDKQVQDMIWLINKGCESPASGVIKLKEWAKAHGHNSTLIGQLFNEKLASYRDESGYDEDEGAPKILRDYRKIEKTFGSELRYNRLFARVELRGNPFEPAMAKIEFVVDHNLKLKSGRDDIGDCVMKLAKQNEYHPVREYLEKCFTTHGTSTKILEGFAARYFGTSTPIHQTAAIKFLISAVARAYEPGCQVDAALILQGGQGVRKSTFFRVLASPEWFDDSFGNAGDKDERLKLHCAWILEWAELESIFKRKDMSQVKAFITTKIDRIRPPYGRSVEVMARSSVFCGTTNQTDFLNDGTGNRRFWVLPVGGPIDTDRLEKERDQIWAAATALYKSGVAWHLTTEEEALMNEGRKEFEATDAWEDEVLDWIEGKEEISLQEILSDVLSIELNQQDKRCQMRIRDILTRSNWYQKPNPAFYKGKRVRTWIKKESFT